MNYFYYLYLIPVFLGLFMSIRYRKLSRYLPFATFGFCLYLMEIVVPIFIRWLVPAIHDAGEYSNFWRTYSMLLSLLGTGALTLIVTGFLLTFNDMRQRLAFWENTSQNGWNFERPQETIHQEAMPSAFVPNIPVTPQIDPSFMARYQPDQTQSIDKEQQDTVPLGNTTS